MTLCCRRSHFLISCGVYLDRAAHHLTTLFGLTNGVDMSNIRNSRTTHPRKQARRDRAAQRFGIRSIRGNPEYVARKLVEAAALGIAQPTYF